MSFEQLLETIYASKLDGDTNNHIYQNLTKEELIVLRSLLKENPVSKVINPTRNGMHYVKNDIDELVNVEFDFEKYSIHDLLSYILFVLNIDIRINYFSYPDLLLFIEVLKRKGISINLHLFNSHLLTPEDTKLLNNLMIMNLNSLNMQVYLEENYNLNSKYDENEREVVEGTHYKKTNILAPSFTIKLKNEYVEKKAS